MFCIVDSEGKILYSNNKRLYAFTSVFDAENFVDELEIDKSLIKIVPYKYDLKFSTKPEFLPKKPKEYSTEEQERVIKKLEENNVDLDTYAPLGLLPNGQPRKRRARGSSASVVSDVDAPKGLLPNGQPRKRKFSHRKRRKN